MGVSCRKKERFLEDPGAQLTFSTDSVLFDTVFTTIGSSTRRFTVRNPNNQRILISRLTLERGPSSPFFLNVDGAPGRSFTDLEIAANDSMYVFVQVHIDPNGANSELIVNDKMICEVNGGSHSVVLEAWGQDAYYHYPTRALKFSNGTYLPYSLADTLKESYTLVGDEMVWKNDKPHVIYGYLVVDSLQKLRIPENTEVYLNYKAGLWVYRYGRLRVLGKKGQEVRFQGARRERDLIDEPGQWDRIWINEGSDQNVIDYAIIKDGFIGVQAELFDFNSFLGPGTLSISNSIIQNMSMWGIYGLAYKIAGANNVISNCQEHCVNLTFGGAYAFYHCTFVNNWKKEKVREKGCVRINNHTDRPQVLEHEFYFGNCIMDGSRAEELEVDLKSEGAIVPSYTLSGCVIRTTMAPEPSHFFDTKTISEPLKYDDWEDYKFMLHEEEQRASGFTGPRTVSDAQFFPFDIAAKARNTTSVTAGAYEK